MNQELADLTIEQKRALLTKLLQRGGAQPRLSLTQERIWQLDQIQPGTAVYNFQSAFELQGPLDLPLLETALARMVVRHDVLRTRYGAEKGQPRLEILAELAAGPALEDLRAVAAEGQAAVQRLAQADAQRGFDLDRPPLFRLTVARLASDRHVLILTMHHIVSDLLSLEILFQELGAYYSAALEGREVDLPPLDASYQDFARDQREAERQDKHRAAFDYWRGALSSPPKFELYGDFPRPPRPSGAAASQFFTFPPGLVQAVETFARGQQATPFMVLLAGFYALLHGCSGQRDIIVGCPTGGRTRGEYEALIGMFSYPLLMRADLSDDPSFAELVRRVRRTVLEAAEHADLPLARVVEAAQQSGSQRAPLARTMFSYVSRLKQIAFSGLGCKRVPADRGMSDFDFFLTLYQEQGSLHGVFEYNTDLFAADTVRRLIECYRGVLTEGVDGGVATLARLAAGVPVKRPLRPALAATFTADPLQEVFGFWSGQLGLPVRPEFAPYNQVFQQLLDPGSLLYAPERTLNLLLVRPEDWARYAGPEKDKDEVIVNGARDFVAMVRDAVGRMPCPCKVYLCPPSQGGVTEPASTAAEAVIREGLVGVPEVEVLAEADYLAHYPVSEVHDAQANRIGHIPYTRGYFVALGTAIFRKLAMAARKPYKVVVLDCDNTLWHGVCAEDGVQGVAIDEPRRILQSFMAEQSAAGMLLCLCSKNRPEEPLAVFEQHPEMLLRLEQIVAHRINWEPKSANLRALAEELQLGLDSFVFIDDNPVECAEVASGCPEVLTLRLPEDPADIPRFLRHVWAFDRDSVSAEDLRRLQSYRENRQRKALRSSAASLEEFLRGLELQVDIAPAGAEQLPRLAQLSQRTNQFNASGVRYGEAELRLSREQGLAVLAVQVRDRFGDYGLVGAVTYRVQAEALLVESFQLSCRVLGRGVEHRIVAALGEIALERGQSTVRIEWRSLERNQPFLQFLDSLAPFPGGAARPAPFDLSAAQARAAALIPPAETSARPKASARPGRNGPAGTAAILARIPHDLGSVEHILSRLDQGVAVAAASRGTAVDYSAPKSELERTIASVWAQVLHREQVGRTENFFEVGGNSLLLVQVNSRLIEETGMDIAITELFQYPTVASLSAYLGDRASIGAGLPETSNRAALARSRMQQRKQRLAPAKGLNFS